MTYDHWKTTNPADDELGSDPRNDHVAEPFRTILTAWWASPQGSVAWNAWFKGAEDEANALPIGLGRTEAEAIADLKAQVDEEQS